MNVIALAKLLNQYISQGAGEYLVATFNPPEGLGSELVTEVVTRDVSNVLEFYTGTVPHNPNHIKWQKRDGYECSSVGDKRFSALNALMPDGRSIEMWYQCDIKGYDIGGTDWKKGKGKPPLFEFPNNQLWQLYLNLWRLWAIQNSHLIIELMELAKTKDNILSDCFASSPINQARALATIINEWLI